MNLTQILAEASEHWHAQTDPVLRLTVLRDFYRQLHGLRTQFLSQDSSEKMQLLEAWMERIRLLRYAPDLDKLDSNLTGVLSPGQRIKASAFKPDLSGLPESLRVLLERADRDWERAIAGRALSAGWSFWSLEKTVALQSAEGWHRAFLKQIWPDGVSLFVEQAGVQAPDKQSWNGRWIVTWKPGADPRLISGEFQPAQWTALFPSQSASGIL